MSKFTFHYGGTAFHRAFLTYHKNVEAHTKAELRDPERRGFCAQRLPFVEIHTSRKCSLESTWVGTMWPQTVQEGLTRVRACHTLSGIALPMGIYEN